MIGLILFLRWKVTILKESKQSDSESLRVVLSPLTSFEKTHALLHDVFLFPRSILVCQRIGDRHSCSCKAERKSFCLCGLLEATHFQMHSSGGSVGVLKEQVYLRRRSPPACFLMCMYKQNASCTCVLWVCVCR